MENVNKLINQQFPHITTNTIILIIAAIIAFYILMKVISSMVKLVALVVACWFILMSLQSTNVVNIPIVKQAYSSVEKYIPSKELWTKASDYAKDAVKIKKAIDDLNSSK